MSMKPAEVAAAHVLLDILVAQDMAQGGTHEAGMELVETAMNSLDLAALFNFEEQDDGTFVYDIGALIGVTIAPLLFLATELAGCAEISFDQVVTHVRDYIESLRERQ